MSICLYSIKRLKIGGGEWENTPKVGENTHFDRDRRKRVGVQSNEQLFEATALEKVFFYFLSLLARLLLRLRLRHTLKAGTA